jgi:hypothetical protein
MAKAKINEISEIMAENNQAISNGNEKYGVIEEINRLCAGEAAANGENGNKANQWRNGVISAIMAISNESNGVAVAWQ